MLKLIFAKRGGAKVMVTYGRRRLPCPRKVSEDTARRKLLDAGLAYLRRRRKTLPWPQTCEDLEKAKVEREIAGQYVGAAATRRDPLDKTLYAACMPRRQVDVYWGAAVCRFQN